MCAGERTDDPMRNNAGGFAFCGGRQVGGLFARPAVAAL